MFNWKIVSKFSHLLSLSTLEFNLFSLNLRNQSASICSEFLELRENGEESNFHGFCCLLLLTRSVYCFIFIYFYFVCKLLTEKKYSQSQLEFQSKPPHFMTVIWNPRQQWNTDLFQLVELSWYDCSMLELK